MMIHPPYVILRLLPHILQEVFINRVKRIAKLKLAPKQNPTLVSEIEQKVWTICSRSLRGKHVQVSKKAYSLVQREGVRKLTQTLSIF
jgi:hypothetical protein